MDVTRIPKIELHLHLDGAVPPETMWRMAQEKHVSLPVDTLDEFYAWLVKTADCRDVNTYLARFELPLQLMQDAPGITRITCDVLTTLARQGHIYDELRFAPQLHTRAGLRQQDAIEAVLAGREQALRAFPDYRCGILLCCMCIGPETANMAENLETVRLTQEYLGSGVVGMDLAGAEGIVPLRNFHPIFDLARELGLPFTCHAGDSQGPDTVRDALDFGAKRIGHGHHIFDDPTLWQRAIQNGVTLEICPTSNIQCKTQPSYAQHPAKKLLDAGLRVCISTDNMTTGTASRTWALRRMTYGPWPASRWTPRFYRSRRSGSWLGNFKLKQIFEYFLTHPPPLWYTCRRGGGYHMLSEQELLEMERPVSARHAPMRRCDRAAQFAPFAALSGFGEAVQEAGRRARERIESAERSDKLPDDALFDFDPDFMDGMP